MRTFPLAGDCSTWNISGGVVRISLSGLLATLLTIASAALTAAQGTDEAPPLSSLIGRQVTAVRLERSGQTLNDPRLAALVETRPGGPLSMREVRNSLLHLFNTGL